MSCLALPQGLGLSDSTAAILLYFYISDTLKCNHTYSFPKIYKTIIIPVLQM